VLPQAVTAPFSGHVIVSGIDAACGTVVFDNAATGSAEAGSSVVVGDGPVMPMALAMATGLPALPASDLHVAPPLDLHFPVIGLDWMLP